MLVNGVQTPPAAPIILSPGFSVSPGANSNVQSAAWQEGFASRKSLAVVEVTFGPPAPQFGRSDSYLFRQSIYGKTGKGRLITVVVSYAKQPRPYVISARVMSKKERRDYCEN